MHQFLPEMKLRKIFPTVYFINTYPPEERVQVLPSEKELSILPDYSPKIFKNSDIDYFMERPSATF